MATVNMTRKNGMHKKKEISVFAAILLSAVDYATSADVYELFKLPKNSLVIRRDVLNIVASDAAVTATADLGVTGTPDAFANDMNLKATAATSPIPRLAVTTDGNAQANLLVLNQFTPIFYETGATVIFTPTYNGAKTVGTHLVVIEYIEIDKTDGEMTDFSATA